MKIVKALVWVLTLPLWAAFWTVAIGYAAVIGMEYAINDIANLIQEKTSGND